MKKLLCMLIFILLSAHAGFAQQSVPPATEEKPSPSPTHAVNQGKSGSANQRGANPAVIDGAAKKTVNINGADIRLKH